MRVITANDEADEHRRLRGRDAGYPAPPAQTPACSFPAPGSSVVLTSVMQGMAVQQTPVERYRLSAFALLAIARSEVGSWCSDPTVSGMSFLCALRTSVKSFPMYVAFPRSEYYA